MKKGSLFIPDLGHLVSFVFFNQMLPAFQYLPAIYRTGGDEIDACLQPQGMILESDLVERGSHAVDAYISVDSEGGREDVREISPKSGHGASRPRNAGEKQQWHGGENEQKHACLAIADGNGRCHGKENAG